MAISRALTIDGALAVLLAFALGVVIVLDRGRNDEPLPPKPTPTAVPAEKDKPIRLAVTPPQFDNMGKLLDGLGKGFPYTQIRLEDLEEPKTLANYDVIFLTCGTDPQTWLETRPVGDLKRPGIRLFRYDEKVIERVRAALREFVGQGGTLYASDLRFGLVATCFPELYDGGEIVSGGAGMVDAEVVDDGLRDLVGKSVDLKFDLPDWQPAMLAAKHATVYLRGAYTPARGGAPVSAPLLVKVPFEKGTIIFTSFHNEKVNNELETKLLQFLVFTAVTARETAAAQQTMVSGGFSLKKQNLLSATPGAGSVRYSYTNAQRGPLKFALIFRNEGARLSLSVTGPDGQTRKQEGASTFTIDVADAAPGEWTYAATALEVPYENFAYSLSVGSR